VSDPALGLRSIRPGFVRNPADKKDVRVCLTTVGALRCYGPREAGSPWGLRSSFALPVAVDREESALTITSPPVRVVGPGSPAGPILATALGEQSAADRERLMTVRIDPFALEGAARAECWLHLPSREAVIDHAFVALDGRPALVASTRPADKLSFFGEKLLRAWVLEPDRTRTGRAPLIALETRANLWQRIAPVPLDVDRDGREDLVVAYWKGLKDDTVVLDAYLRRDDGTYERSPATTSFDVEDADRSVLEYGKDLDGDRVPELILLGEGGILVFAGSPGSRRGKGLVESKPLCTVPLVSPETATAVTEVSVGTEGMDVKPRSASRWTPRIEDLDGDGRGEIVVTAPLGSRPGRLIVVRLAARK
jgi:hypothetical protein